MTEIVKALWQSLIIHCYTSFDGPTGFMTAICTVKPRLANTKEGLFMQLQQGVSLTMCNLQYATAAVKILLTVMTLLQQKPDCGCYVQRKWRSGQPVSADEHAHLLL